MVATADRELGRRLSGLVRRGPLRHDAVQAHTTVVSSLAAAADLRLREVATAVRSSAERGLGDVTPTGVDRWWSDLQAADAADEFLVSETAYIVNRGQVVGSAVLPSGIRRATLWN
ncbi:hypothetical protein [Frankia gtarii]|uniref:hypothetical protein n=1 Tax=Frankia gtarii TaxID=2950102 RepID=UPI0021BE73B5|nr:hypothetical protein [Frankia gtarii]